MKVWKQLKIDLMVVSDRLDLVWFSVQFGLLDLSRNQVRRHGIGPHCPSPARVASDSSIGGPGDASNRHSLPVPCIMAEIICHNSDFSDRSIRQVQLMGFSFKNRLLMLPD